MFYFFWNNSWFHNAQTQTHKFQSIYRWIGCNAGVQSHLDFTLLNTQIWTQSVKNMILCVTYQVVQVVHWIIFFLKFSSYQIFSSVILISSSPFYFIFIFILCQWQINIQTLYGIRRIANIALHDARKPNFKSQFDEVCGHFTDLMLLLFLYLKTAWYVFACDKNSTAILNNNDLKLFLKWHDRE